MSKLRTLSLFSLITITVGSVDSVRNLPATALFGSSLIFFFILAAIFFLIPCALVSAELASAWSDESGVYIWVKEAFGQTFGFLAIWFQWVENVIWYPAILSFVAGTIAYLISPSLATNKYFLVSVIMITFWGATIINILGMKSSAWFSNFCAVIGLFFPMGFIILLGLSWVLMGKPLQVHFNLHEILPTHTNQNVWVSLTGIILSCCGMEIATVHARDAKNPQRQFPKALLISTIIILVTLIFGSLAIAVVLPQNHISLVAGIMQAFSAFFSSYHLSELLPVVALMLVIGGMGSVSNWIIAPTKGLLIAAKDGNLPAVFQKENRYGAPGLILIIQAIIVTFITAVFLLMPSVNASYWLLTALAAQLYMLMYIMMFAAGIYLRYKDPHRERLFRLPGKRWGMWLVAGAGVIGSTLTLIVGFIPPSNIQIGSTTHYETLLLTGLAIMTLSPLVIYRFRKIETPAMA